MGTISFSEALHRARQEHQVRLVSDGVKSLGYRWTCSCGKGSPSRLIPPSKPMALAASERHIEGVARKIQKEA